MPYSLGGVRQDTQHKCHIATEASGKRDKWTNRQHVPLSLGGVRRKQTTKQAVLPYWRQAGNKQRINITYHLATGALGKTQNMSHIAAEASGRTNNKYHIALGASGKDKQNGTEYYTSKTRFKTYVCMIVIFKSFQKLKLHVHRL